MHCGLEPGSSFFVSLLQSQTSLLRHDGPAHDEDRDEVNEVGQAKQHEGNESYEDEESEQDCKGQEGKARSF